MKKERLLENLDTKKKMLEQYLKFIKHRRKGVNIKTIK